MIWTRLTPFRAQSAEVTNLARNARASKYALMHAQHLEVYHVKWYVWEPGADELNSTNIPLIEGEAGWAG